MGKMEEPLDITVLTPKTIPEYAAKTGRDEDELMIDYLRAKSQNKALFGMFMAAPWWMDEVAVDDTPGPSDHNP